MLLAPPFLLLGKKQKATCAVEAGGLFVPDEVQ